MQSAIPVEKRMFSESNESKFKKQKISSFKNPIYYVVNLKGPFHLSDVY